MPVCMLVRASPCLFPCGCLWVHTLQVCRNMCTHTVNKAQIGMLPWAHTRTYTRTHTHTQHIHTHTQHIHTHTHTPGSFMCDRDRSCLQWALARARAHAQTHKSLMCVMFHSKLTSLRCCCLIYMHGWFIFNMTY